MFVCSIIVVVSVSILGIASREFVRLQHSAGLDIDLRAKVVEKSHHSHMVRVPDNKCGRSRSEKKLLHISNLHKMQGVSKVTHTCVFIEILAGASKMNPSADSVACGKTYSVNVEGPVEGHVDPE